MVDPCQTANSVIVYGMRRTRLVVDVGLVLVLCIIGLVGNTVSFYVLSKMKGGTTPWLLRSLAVADSVYLFTCLFFQVGVTLYTYMDSVRRALTMFAFVERSIYAFASMAQTAAVWIVVVITCNRWAAICHPLWAKQTATNKKAGAAVMAAVTFAVLFNIPLIFELKVISYTSRCTNVTRWATVATALSRNPIYSLVYKTILCFIFRSFLPLLILVILNIQLIRAVHSSATQDGKVVNERRGGGHGNGGSSGQDRLTKMIIAVVSIFIICQLPDITYRILMTIIMYGRRSRVGWDVKMYYLGMFVNFMLTLNSAINFLIYFMVGKTFRQTLKKHCCFRPGAGSHWYQAVARHRIGSSSSMMNTKLTSVKSSSNKPAWSTII